MAHIRQSRPDAGLEFQLKVRNVFPLRSEADVVADAGMAGSYLRLIDVCITQL